MESKSLSPKRRLIFMSVLVLLAWAAVGFYYYDRHYVTPFPKWPNLYGPILVIGKTFRNEEVLLDGYSYDHCTFENVTFVYNGTTPPNNIFSTIRGSFTFRTDNPAVEGTALLFKGLGFLKTDVNYLAASCEASTLRSHCNEASFGASDPQ